MLVYDATRDQLDAALRRINADLYAGNLQWRRLDHEYTTRTGAQRWRLTLTVRSSAGPGARISAWMPWRQRPRRIAAACWHAHGNFFDALFDLAPDARIRTGTHLITAQAGNWQDRNIGSLMYPTYYSDACLCLARDDPQAWPDWQPPTGVDPDLMHYLTELCRDANATKPRQLADYLY